MSYIIVPAAFMAAAIAWELVATPRKREFRDYLGCLLFLPWILFVVVALIQGGTAWNNAPNDYPYFLIGQYFLYLGGNYTEVSYAVFRNMRILEILGWLFYIAAFVLLIVRFICRRRRPAAALSPQVRQTKQRSLPARSKRPPQPKHRRRR